MKTKQIAYIFLVLAFFIALHQYVTFGSWFELKDVHHEVFIAMFGFASITLFWMMKRGKTR